MGKLKPSFTCRDDMIELVLIHPVLLYIFADINLYASENNYPTIEITRVVDEKIEGVSVSTTHEEGRAIDISVKGFTRQQIDHLVELFNNKYAEDYGAISYSDGKPRLMVFHKGTGWHIHIQIRRL